MTSSPASSTASIDAKEAAKQLVDAVAAAKG